MLDREWISIIDPDDRYERYVFDVSFLLSHYECIYANGCPGVGKGPVIACCGLGAHYVDDEDRKAVEAHVERLGPEYLHYYQEARRNGVTASTPDGDGRTRVKDGGCIFLNREGFGTGPGCALHHYAIDRGEHHMTYKPEVCWMVPLRRIIEEEVADDGEQMWTTIITSYDRGGWGAGGADFDWWCTESPEAFVAEDPVYRGMEQELRTMTGDAVYAELVAYLDERCAAAPKPLPFPLYVR